MIKNESLKRRHTALLILLPLIVAALIAYLIFYQPNYYPIQVQPAAEYIRPKVTKNTVRIFAGDIYQNAAALTQITYPSSFEDDRPNAVILVREDKKEDGLLAASVTHHPINAPILFVNKDSIPEATWKEMERLDPQGVFVDDNVKAILIGDIGKEVKNKIKSKGWRYRHIEGNNPFKLSKNIDDYLASIHGDHRDTVIIASIDAAEYAYPAVSWNAHMGDGLFFVEKDSVPQEVKDALNSRYGKAYIYIMGGQNEISSKVVKELASYGHIQIIPNNGDIYGNSAGFAGYKDFGKNFGWWISKRNRDFGWGIAEAGHNFIFINPNDWHLVVSASVLSHKGKHGPMLLVQGDYIPESVKNYLQTVRPSKTTPQEQLYNHGWIIGGEKLISTKLQAEIDMLLGYEEGVR
ncbi:MAG: putative cell-surface protein [Clostridia bacterium]|jgi:putative cell wall-binding protein|nr:putative cell-surface protein [Clostridia bacterium]